VQALQGATPARGDILMHEGPAAVEDPVGLANKGRAGGTPSSNGTPGREQEQAPVDPDDGIEEDEEVRSEAWPAQSRSLLCAFRKHVLTLATYQF
jgi:hypothetical protein